MTRLPAFPSWDAYAAAVARALLQETSQTRDYASSGHAYKTELVEVFGSGGTITDARCMWPVNPAVKVSPLYLANEVSLYVTGSPYPPIWKWWPWERVRDYYAFKDRIQRPYGYFATAPEDALIHLSPMLGLIELLADHPSTKRAVVSFYPPEFIEPSGDTPCTIATQYRIRGDLLETLTLFRSHDFYGGFRTDPLRISFVQQFVAAVLRRRGLTVETGALHQVDGSVHYYPQKKHGDLGAIADYKVHTPTRNWHLFEHAYTDEATIWRDLEHYIDLVDTGEKSHVLAIVDAPLRWHAEKVLEGIEMAQARFGTPPRMPGPEVYHAR